MRRYFFAILLVLAVLSIFDATSTLKSKNNQTHVSTAKPISTGKKIVTKLGNVIKKAKDAGLDKKAKSVVERFKSKLTTGAIIAIVIGTVVSVAVLILIIGVVYLVVKHKPKSKSSFTLLFNFNTQ